MGLSQSSIRILVLGLSGVGKTFLLDLLSGDLASGRPTNGYHEISYLYDGHRFIFTEYGGSVDWEALVKMDTAEPFRFIYYIVHLDIYSARNALLMISSHLPNVPIILIWNMGAARANFGCPNVRASCSLPRIVDNSTGEECLEKIYRLLKWTSAQNNTV